MRARFPAAVVLLGLGTINLPAQRPEFEVATIKVNNTGSGSTNFPVLKNGTLSATNVSLMALLQAAYDLSAARIIGPSWLDSDRYDVAGKSPAGVADSELRPMLRALLNHRFRISSHTEMRTMSIYAMVVSKDGLKMAAYDPAKPAAPPRNRNNGGAVIFGSGTMPQLAGMLTRSAGRPVMDKTGVDGRYNYTLTFTPGLAHEADSSPDSPPGLFVAIQQQLGLKLESTKDSIEVLVIDHAERAPIEN